ncbi:MAG: glycoside hydrolase family 3 C-terminal domain-containing protein [Firmicutes bacterium]|nr:glycoside hydrolase family 3 C-terminal domain-containing protein [Bacillota bacterium]
MTTEIYKTASFTIQERTADLLSRMSLDEKLAQLSCVWVTSIMDKDGFSREKAGIVAPYGIGEITRISGSTALLPTESARIMNDIQRHMVQDTRLGIPVLIHEEGTGGFLARNATVFPQSLGLAASFDTALVEEVAAVIREQMRAVGARHCLAPVLDVARDPRWGRVEETFGEDPYLASAMGIAYVHGLQTSDLTEGVLATGKHFIGHALSEGGRNHAPVQLGPRELREVYAMPFAMAISQAGLGSVMNSYGSVDGLACAGSSTILKSLLRDELGFEGMVVADYFSVALLISHHHIAGSKQEAATRAINAGLDMELPETDCFGDPLRVAIEDGNVSIESVDEAVRRVLLLKFKLGLFESPFVDGGKVDIHFETPKQRELARKAATSSIVLLTNNGILPLSENTKKIAVIGPAADDQRLLQGDYHYPAHQQIAYDDTSDSMMSESWNGGADLSMLPRSYGEWQPGPYFTDHVTPLEGIRNLLGASAEVIYEKGCDVTGDTADLTAAVNAAKSADVAIVVVGGQSGLALSCTVGEARDATDLSLTGMQEKLIEEVAATGVPMIVIVMSGRVHTLAKVAEKAQALLQAWPLGEEGGNAIADIIFGRSNPSGRLPISLPRNVGQIPRYMGHRAGGSTAMFYGAYSDSPTSPLFAFGHGLSYTTFSYSNLSIDAVDTATPVRVQLSVTNTGDCFGEEVVQCYVNDLSASVVRPEQQLVGFARAKLDPGDSCRIIFEVPSSALAFYDESMRRIIEPGLFRFSLGKSSADILLSAEVLIKGDIYEQPLSLHGPTRISIV